MITVQVNGKPHEIEPGCSVSELIDALGLTEKRIAIEMNGEIIPKSQHSHTTLNADSSLEIVVAVGGG